jgi:hypothetical protein
MAITKVINDAVDLNQTSDYSGLRLPVGTTGNVVESFTTDYLVVGGGGGSGTISAGGGAGGLRTSYNNSTTTTNSLNFPSGKTAIATYMLDNNATDISGNYNGTEVNITYNTGKYGGAAIFNGSSSIITNTSQVIPNGTASFSFWYNPSGATGLEYFIGNGVATSSKGISVLYTGSTGIFTVLILKGVTALAANFSGTTAYLNTDWHNVSVVWDGTTTANAVKLYVNGSLEAEGTSDTSSASIGSYTTFGIGGVNGGAYGEGKIDQVRIYDSALSATDVSNIYNNEVQANSGGGTAAESSLTLTGGTAYDVTVGAGGAAVNLTGGNNGGSSIFSTITSLGGGFGGLYNGSAYIAPGNGGSGGGGSLTSSLTRGNGTLNQGYEGGYGDNSGPPYSTGGGGGAASPGQNSPGGNTGATGGTGLEVNIIGGSGNYYAGGGGGAGETTGASGGIGGGGDGSGGTNGGEDGAFNTGGGAGGWRNYSTGFSGGSGVVILRYPTASVSSFTTTGTLNTPSTTNTVADNNYPTTNTAYYQLDGNANGYLTTNDLGTLDYPSGTGCVALYELNGNANGYLTTTDLSTVNYPAGAGCIALYELNGNANDTSNTYNGSDTNITYNTGAFDQAAVFNGSSSGINLPSSLNTSVIDATGAFSISMWINANDISTIQYLFSASTANNIDLGINSNSQGVGKIVWTIYNTSYSYLISTTTITTNTWYNIVVTYDNGSRELFINGVSQGTATKTLVESSIEPTLGYRNTGGSVRFNGLMDQVRIFNTALTQAQVTTLARGISTSYSGAETNITYNTGAFGQAAVFNGSSSKIELPTSTFSPSTFSLSAWCNVTSDTDENTIIELVDNQTYPNNTNIVLSAGSTGYSSRFLLRNYTTNQYNYNPSGTVSKNVWKHYAMTYDGSTVKSYIDGSLVDSGSLTLSNTVGAISSIQIGLSSGNRHLNGSIDQVRIFNTALTANNITTLARGVGTAYNGATSNVTWANGRFSQAAVFNGSSSYITSNSLPSIGTGDFTFSCWFNQNSGSSQGALFSTTTQWFAANGSVSPKVLMVTDDTVTKKGDTAYSQETWNHAVFARESGVLKIYQNGTEVFSGAYTDSWDMTQFGIGVARAFGSKVYYFNGSIDQVRIFSSALTSSQVTELYEEHYQTKFTDGSDTAIVFTEGTGTVTFSGVDPAPPQGALRTNTSYSEDGSASVIEHYNGTNWKYFDAIKYCTTNTLNFPSGAGCIASYNLDNNVNDIGNTYNGINSNVTFNASGKFGAAAVFNGSSSGVQIASTATAPLNLSSGNFSISMWVNPSNLTNNNKLIYKWGTSASLRNWIATITTNGVLYVVEGTTAGDTLMLGTATIPTNTWTHIAITRAQGGNLVQYINGVATDTFSTQNRSLKTSTEPLYIGYQAGQTTNFTGLIDQVRIFNDSLTSDEVSKLYNNEIACS